MLCPACSKQNSNDALFCAACGTSLQTTSLPTQTSAGEAPPEHRGITGPSAPGDRPARFVPGQVLDKRYRIVSLLGRGGMGEVYRADDLKLGRAVALKFLPQEVEDDSDRLERFLNEARVALSVTHPNVCRVHDIGTVDGHHYISMEYIDGEDLASLLRRIGRLPEDKAVQIARQLCAGLAAAHAEGILHRDLKPANVMLDGRGRAKITDFGLAGLAASMQGDAVMAGTPGYMAPEQLAGNAVSVRSDIYALGLVLYELFTGKVVYKANSLAELRQLQTHTSPSSPASHVPGLDSSVEHIVLRCLSHQPEDRPASATAVAHALPGGDPVAAALAAGETPSPELLAEAGEREGLKPAVAVLLMVLAFAAFLGATRWAGPMSLLHILPLDRSPAVMIDRAQEIIQRLGYTEPVYQEPVDQAWGLFTWEDVIRSVREASQSPDRWQALSQRPDAASFWYRQSPRNLYPEARGGDPVFDRGYTRLTNPPQVNAGEVSILLDLEGNLRRLEVTPKRFSTRQEGEPDWSILFELAHLDQSRFEEVRPRYQRYQSPDYRRAWSGSRESAPEILLHVEAGSFEGRPTLFNVAAAAGLESLGMDPEPELNYLGAWVLRSIQPMLILVVLFSGAVLAKRNINQGRADLRGAFLFATTMFLAMTLHHILESHHLINRLNLGDLWPSVAGGSFFGLASWVMYTAAEPFGRQIWPTMFVSLNRLLSRTQLKLRDPLLGQSILTGVLASALLFAVRGPIRLTISTWLEGTPPYLHGFDADLLLGQRQVLASLLEVASGGTAMGFLLVMIIVAMRRVTRKPWLAILMAVTLWTLIMSDISQLESVVYGLVTSVALVLVLLRWGLVAMLVMFVVERLAWMARCADWNAWHSEPAVTILVVVGALTLFGGWASMRPTPSHAAALSSQASQT